MDKKGILISTDIDTTEVEKKLSDLQKKINSFRTGGMQMDFSSNSLGGANQANVDRMRQSQLNVFKRLQSQVSNELGNQVKSHQDIIKKMDDQVKKMKELDKSTKEYQKTLEEINKLRDDELDSISNISRLQSQQSQMRASDPRTFSEMGGFGRLGTAFSRGGFGGLNRAAGRMGLGGLAGLAGSAIGGLGAGLGAVGSGMQLLGNFNYMRADLPARQAARQAEITQIATQTRARAMRGENTEDIIFAPERAKAVTDTADFFKEADSSRRMRATGKALGIGGAMATGAYFGSALGPIGTVVGAGVGAIGAGLAGLMDEEAYNAIFDRDELSRMTGKDAMQRYETFKMARETEDPTKYYQKKFFQENKGRLLSLQRSGGLNEEEMYGGLGYIRQGAGEFGFRERAGMSEQMIAAGGSGSAAIGGGLNVLALQAQRSMGLTNSGQALGRLSSYMNAEESEDAFIRILSKGVSVGLDKSEFREEQKDYLAQVTAMSTRIGGGAEDMISAAMTAGIEGDISRRSLEMAGTGLGDLLGAMNQKGGIIGAARAGLISEEFGDYIGGFDQLKLQNIRMEEINEENPLMQRLYSKMKKGGYEGTMKDFVNKRQRLQRQSMLQTFEDTGLFGEDFNLEETLNKADKGKLSKDMITDIASGLPFIDKRFEGKTQKELEIIARQYFGMERQEEEDKKKRAAALKKKSEIEKQRIKRGGIIPFGNVPDIMGSMMNIVKPQDELPTLTDEEAKLTGDFIKTSKGTGIDRVNQAAAQQEAKIYQNLNENMSNMFENIKANLDQSLGDQKFMEDFAKAVNKGDIALQGFIDKLNQISGKKQSILDKNKEMKGGKKMQSIREGF